MKLAIVDPNPTYSRMFKLTVETEHPEDNVRIFNDPREFSNSINELGGFDAVIIGQDEPESSNIINLAQKVREICHCPVIGMTLFSDISFADQTFRKGDEERAIALLHSLKDAA